MDVLFEVLSRILIAAFSGLVIFVFKSITDRRVLKTVLKEGGKPKHKDLFSELAKTSAEMDRIVEEIEQTTAATVMGMHGKQVMHTIRPAWSEKVLP